MNPELELLAWTVVLTFVQMLIAVAGATLQVGLPALAGNREGLAPATGWAGRAHRAHRNMLENLVLFAALVLIAALADRTNPMTLLGAQIFFWVLIVTVLGSVAFLFAYSYVIWRDDPDRHAR